MNRRATPSQESDRQQSVPPLGQRPSQRGIPSLPLGDWSPAIIARPIKPPLQEHVEDIAMRAVSGSGALLTRILGPRSSGFGILMYHRICDNIPGVAKPSLNVTPNQFGKQISGLLRRGYSIWSLRKLLECHESGQTIPPRVTAITFDDGYQGVYRHAFPVLKALNVPASVFLPTAYLGGCEPFPFDYWALTNYGRIPRESFRCLTPRQCKQMSAQGLVEFGVHTHLHADFRDQPAAFRADLSQSVQIIKSLFDVEEVTFAFPFGTPRLGFVSDELVSEAKRTGVVCSLTTESVVNHAGSDPYRWGRFNVFPWDTAATLAAKLEGWYSWAPQLKQSLLATVSGGARLCQADSEQRPVSSRRGSRRPTRPAALAKWIDSEEGESSHPMISVIVPTFNRAAWLGEALATLAAQETNDWFRYEIVVIDNGSTDATRDVVHSAAEQSRAPIRYVQQGRPGDAPARNKGIQAAGGEWFAFFDDDQLAPGDWLRNLWQAAHDSCSKIVGGPVLLDLAADRLEALGDVCRRALRETQLYAKSQPYEDRDSPGAGNALVAREVFDCLGGFDESMHSGGSDIDFFARARRHGYRLWYCRQAPIRHRVPEERLSPSYFRRDAVSGGADHARYLDYARGGKWRLLGCSLARLGQAGLLIAPRLAWAWARGRSGELLGQRTRLWRCEGHARRTLSILFPHWFEQRAFFESLDFRQRRDVGIAAPAPLSPRSETPDECAVDSTAEREPANATPSESVTA